MSTLKPSKKIFINDRPISLTDPVYFIAEIGSNYDQSLQRAKDLIYLAKEAGADAAKFQHYTADTLVSDFGFKNFSQAKSHQANWEKSVFETYEDASLNRDWTFELAETCKDVGIDFFTSPYSIDLVDFVDEYVPAYKIGSGDITWIEIIEHIASKNKPIIIATGASDILDVERAVNSILKINSDIVLLQCNTNYTKNSENFDSLNLHTLTIFREKFHNILTGLSEHMQGNISVLGSVALGARVIEKHFTDSTNRKGPDHPFSMTKDDFLEMVNACRILEKSLGDGIKRVENNEKETIIVQRRSICAKENLPLGHILAKEDFQMLRPCTDENIQPYEYEILIGKVLNKNMAKGEPFKLSFTNENMKND